MSQSRTDCTAVTCNACHFDAQANVPCHGTVCPGGPPYSGGQTLTAALGTVYSSNLTPDKQTGIGGWTPDYAVISRERHI